MTTAMETPRVSQYLELFFPWKYKEAYKNSDASLVKESISNMIY